jgi:uncharacterized membrane protein
MKRFSRFLLIFFAVGVSLASMRYLDFRVQGVLNDKSALLLQNVGYRSIFYTHVLFGITALLTGSVQFLPKFRRSNFSLHRTLGKIYVIACMTGGLAGLLIAPFATGGFIATLGFTGLAIAWLVTTWRAYQTARQRDFLAHHQWTTRSYAVTLSAVTLRIWLPLFVGIFGWDFIPSYQFISFFCWVPNVLVAEWLIQRRMLAVEKV